MKYRVRIATKIEVTVEVDAPDEDTAADTAWEIAQAYAERLGTNSGDHRIRYVEASFDGIGAHEVEEQTDRG